MKGALRVAAVLAGLATSLLLAPAAAANTYTADLYSDSALPLCPADPDPDTCSLRRAISSAAANPGMDTVQLVAGPYTLTLTGGSADDNATGDLDYTASGDLDISGPGAGLTSISAAGLNDRIIDIATPGDFDVRIFGATLTGGDAPAADGNEEGGAIEFNSAGGVLVVGGSVLFDNEAPGGGGAIDMKGPGSITHSRIVGNDASPGNGGGVRMSTDVGVNNFVDIGYTEVSGNQATNGGGVAALGDAMDIMGTIDPSVSTYNTTIAGNAATFGAGIAIRAGAAGTIRVTTIARNNAALGPGGIDHTLDSPVTTVNVESSLIAANTATFAGQADCQGNYTSFGQNVIGDPGACMGFTIEDKAAPNPLIGELSFNGPPGPGFPLLTQTIPLLAGSPAIDFGAHLATNDQRNADRPQGPADDSGAFEYVAPLPTATPAKKCKRKKKGKGKKGAAAKKKCKKKKKKG